MLQLVVEAVAKTPGTVLRSECRPSPSQIGEGSGQSRQRNRGNGGDPQVRPQELHSPGGLHDPAHHWRRRARVLRDDAVEHRRGHQRHQVEEARCENERRSRGGVTSAFAVRELPNQSIF